MTSLDEPPTAVLPGLSEPIDSSTPIATATASEVSYIGLITRGIAFVIDAALVSLVAFLVGAAVALIGSLFHFPHHSKTILAVIGGAAYVLWAAGYFIGFWSATGQTPGDRIMQIRVVTARLERVKPMRGIVRCVGLILATVPLFIGFLPVPFDKKRRGLADWLARTIVVDAPRMSVAEELRVKKRSGDAASRARRA